MTLYLVPTPIGNLSDISDRCRETLQSVDFIAAEDTRVTLRLLNHMGIKKPLVSYYEHNKEVSGPKIVERLLAGWSRMPVPRPSPTPARIWCGSAPRRA